MPKPVFRSEEWVQELKRELNASPAYVDAAKNWEGDFYCVIEPEKNEPLGVPTYLYIDLCHGECREACLV